MDKNHEFINAMYQDASMALDSLTMLINKLKSRDNKIKEVVENCIKGYEKHLKIIKCYMKQNNYEINSVPLINKMGAYMGINMEVMRDNSDSRMADMLIQGFTMGVLNTSKNINKYKGEVNKDIISIANDFLKHQEESIEKLKKYL
jgi:hypothetical protein